MLAFKLLCSEFPPFRGGIGAMALEVARAAAALGVDTEVVAPDYLGKADPSEDAALPFRVRRYRAGPYAGRWLPAYLRAAMIAADGRPDTRLLAADGPSLEALALTRWLHRSSFDALLHGSEIRRAADTRAGRMMGRARTYRVPRKIFTNSAFTQNLLHRKMPFRDVAQTHVAHPGVHSRWFEPADPAALARHLDIEGARVVVCTGRITPRKGQLDLVRALAQADMSAEVRGTVLLVIAGRAHPDDAGYLAQVREEAARAGPIRVAVCHNLDDGALQALYARADLFCLPGSARLKSVEGFGLVFLEAAAQGVPSVAGWVGGVPEAVLDGETGVLVPPDDPVTLGQALAGLLQDPERRARLGAAARRHAAEFTWERCARTILQLP